MELSKKVAYLKGLMEGLKLDEGSPEVQILNVMADILTDMADAVEDNTVAIDAIADYIDELEDGGDPLDEIDTYEYGSDPVPSEEGEEEAASESSGEAAESQTGQEDESIRFNELLENIMTDPNYTDETLDDGSKLIETLKNMVVKQYEEAEEAEKNEASEESEEHDSHAHTSLDDDEREDFITRLENLLSSVMDDEDEEDEEEPFDSVIGKMNCPFCHSEIQLKVSDIAEKIVSCPVCSNKLTIML